ncbi:Golgi integral membrane protein 4-like isoform X1 [Chiloscyllium plagiosum]|uniref:Golgi integral membrane protein 4-like isoform X1 n=2 Tax=Chiloscyllium plagiosum TaxID=36176 RepID=UPI001CB81A99|nr:Golgi integral membrane protein 4-like isoform X1 [Chiloscyllium plagiosum]
MGNGMCSRRQKGMLQTGFCVLVALCFGFGFYTYIHLKENVRGAELLAQKYKQQHESVSAQLQVVYEHRSRLERSLQKERGEHKKTKEDFLVYKLEAQESLNKEKQDAMNRYGALSSQHKILKNQHDEIKKQLLDLQLQHNSLRLEHRKAAETHNQRYLQLHQQKDLEIGTLQDAINKLKHESKQLRRAHQDMHEQLAKAQGQVEEYRQLKEALHAMPSFKNLGLNPGTLQKQNQARQEHPRGPDRNQSQVTEQKEQWLRDRLVSMGEQTLTSQHDGGREAKETVVKDQLKELPQGHAGFGNVPAWDSNSLQIEGANRVLRFTRTVNSLHSDRQNTKVTANGVDQTHHVEQDHIFLEGEPAAGNQQHLPTNEQESENHLISRPAKVKRWDEIINDVNTGNDFKLRGQTDQFRIPSVQNHREPPTVPPHVTRRQWSPGRGNTNRHADRVSEVGEEPEQEEEEEEEEEEEADKESDTADQNDAEKLLMHTMTSRNKMIAQEPLIPDIDQDPAQDPNNQGEDEFEEAELERPDFAGKVPGLKEQQLLIKSIPKGVHIASKEGDEAVDEYQEDVETENEDNGGEMEDDHEDPERIHQEANEEDAGVSDDEANKEEY